MLVFIVSIIVSKRERMIENRLIMMIMMIIMILNSLLSLSSSLSSIISSSTNINKYSIYDNVISTIVSKRVDQEGTTSSSPSSP